MGKERVDDCDKAASLDADATPRRSTSSLGAMARPFLLRQAIYFAGSVFITIELANFPVHIGNWKERAVAVSMLNLLIFLSALATGILVLPQLKARIIGVLTLVIAGLLSGIELIQFAPFMFPLAYPRYVVIGGIFGAIVPMALTLFLLSYLFSKRMVSLDVPTK